MKVYVLLLFLGTLLSAGSGANRWDDDDEVTRGNTTCSCGWVNRKRIVGGSETKRHEYPLMAAVEDRRTQVCGGTILTQWHVLTAAHCTNRRTSADLTVRVGGHERFGLGEGRYRISRILVHELYSRRTQRNDIAILVTTQPIKFSQNVGPACLPTQTMNLTGQTVTAIGWGLTRPGGQFSRVLQKVDLRLISFDDCAAAWARGTTYRPVAGSHICTHESKKDTCTGDSGGPIIWLDPGLNKYFVVGVVSFGSVCGGGVPAVNTDVAAYSNWIIRKIRTSNRNVTACTRS